MDSIKHIADAIMALRHAYDTSGGEPSHCVTLAENEAWRALRALVDEHLAPTAVASLAGGLIRGAKICRSMQPDKTDTEWRNAVWDALEDAAQEMEREAGELAP